MIKSLLILIVFSSVFLLGSVKAESEIDSTADIIEKTSYLKNAKGIFDSIAKSDMISTAKEVSKWGVPLLKAVGKFAKIIAAQIQTESKELKYMKEQFKIINEKMDYVDQSFEDIKRLMDWNIIKIQFSKFELNTDMLQNLILIIIDSSPQSRSIAIDKFLLFYDQVYDNAGEKIYQGFTNQKKIFSENLILAIRKYTKNHRYQMEKFFMGNIQLIYKCLEVESFYLNLKNYTSVQEYWQEQWEERMNTLTELMQNVAEQITETWNDQSKIDIQEFNVENGQLSHKDYAEKLYKFLTDKFRNRIWLIVVYDPLDNDNDHAYKACNGIVQMQQRGHNVIVSNLPLSPKYFNRDAFSLLCTQIPSNFQFSTTGPAGIIMSRYLGRVMKCETDQIGVVIRSKSTKIVMAPDSRRASCQWSGYYNKFFVIHKTLDIIVLG